MKATVYYLTLDDEDVAEINGGGGWECPVGRAYLRAKGGDREQALRLSLFQKAASLDAVDAETVWIALQNIDAPWSDRNGIACHTDFPRSMDVGDVIVWENGKAEYCASIGFQPAPDFSEAFGRGSIR